MCALDVLRLPCMVMAMTTFDTASTNFSVLNKSFNFFIFLQSLVQLSFDCSDFGSLGIDLALPVSGIVGQMIFHIPHYPLLQM